MIPEEIKEIREKMEDISVLLDVLAEKIDNTNIDGVYCPKCNCKKSIVEDVRYNKHDIRVRRRKCSNCGKKWNTIEVLYEK